MWLGDQVALFQKFLVFCTQFGKFPPVGKKSSCSVTDCTGHIDDIACTRAKSGYILIVRDLADRSNRNYKPATACKSIPTTKKNSVLLTIIR